MNIKVVDKEFSRNFALRHYGDDSFKEEMFGEVRNSYWCKPDGGLWTSPDNSEWGWKHWCDAEQFRDCNEEKSFTVHIKEGQKLLIIDGKQDFEEALKEYGIPIPYFKERLSLDFEKLLKDGYSAVWLTDKGQQETRFTYPSNLYGWDCETVLILDKNSVLWQE